jgi:hypothetical protein
MSEPLMPALMELLQQHPYPWKSSTAIYGPPGTAEVVIVDGRGEHVETLDDIAFAEGLAAAVNIAAETQQLALVLAHGGLAGAVSEGAT